MLNEMAQPSINIVGQTWLHGTTKQKYAQGIWENGLQPNQLDKSPYKGQINQTMTDHVYLTTNPKTALGSARPRSGADDPNQIPFILEFDGQDLIDIFPDEDEFGEYMSSYFGSSHIYKDREWLEKYRKALEIPPDEWLADEDIDSEWERLYDTLLEGLKHGWFDYIVACGKLIIPQLTPEEVYDVLSEDSAHNVAHRGTIHPSACYRLTENPIDFLQQSWEYIKENSILVASGDSSFEAVTFINDEDHPSDRNMDDPDEIDETSYYYYTEKNGMPHFNNINITDLGRFYDMTGHKPYTVNYFRLINDQNITDLIGLPVEADSVRIEDCDNITSLEGLTPKIHKELYLSYLPSLTSLEHLTVPESKTIRLHLHRISNEDMQTWVDVNNCSINVGRIHLQPGGSSDE